MQTQLNKCQVVDSPVPIGIVILIGCSRGLYGRYIYISLIRTGGDDGYLKLNEIEVYMGKSSYRFMLRYSDNSKNLSHKNWFYKLYVHWTLS